MKIILSDLNKLLFPECYNYTADRFKNEKMYLQNTSADDYLEGLRNIKFTLKLVKLSLSITNTETRGAVQYLFDKKIDLFYDWHKEYDWYELKPILMFFIIFSHVSSFRAVKKRLDNRNTYSMMEKYMVSLKN
jgi:hypothetical protein